MKTKTIFEPDDFRAMGQMIVRESASKNCRDVSFLASVSYKIGYQFRGKNDPRAGNKIIMISLCDGMIVEYDSIEALCTSLNTDQFGYRPMTVEEIVDVMTFNGNRF